MSSSQSAAIPRLKALAEFRYQLRTFLSFSEESAERHGIAAQQYQLMQVVGSLDDGKKASITYIAERMVLRHNSAVELVDRAERAGLVRRESDESDLRRSLVQLTPKGWDMLAGMVAEHVKTLDGCAGRLAEALNAVVDAPGAAACLDAAAALDATAALDAPAAAPHAAKAPAAEVSTAS